MLARNLYIVCVTPRRKRLVGNANACNWNHFDRQHPANIPPANTCTSFLGKPTTMLAKSHWEMEKMQLIWSHPTCFIAPRKLGVIWETRRQTRQQVIWLQCAQILGHVIRRRWDVLQHKEINVSLPLVGAIASCAAVHCAPNWYLSLLDHFKQVYQDSPFTINKSQWCPVVTGWWLLEYQWSWHLPQNFTSLTHFSIYQHAHAHDRRKKRGQQSE